MSAIVKTRIQNVIALGAVAIAMVLGCGSAQAAVYVGSWDPLFGSPFNTPGQVLGWSGEVQMYVPDACLVGTYQTAQGVGCNSSADPLLRQHIIGASVSLYDADTSTVLETLTFAPNGLYPFVLNTVDILNGQVVGIGTGYSQPLAPSSPFAGINAYSFALGFSLSEGPSLVAIDGMNQFFSLAQAIYDVLPARLQPGAASWYGQNVYGPIVRGSIEAGNGSDPLPEENFAAFRRSFSGEVPEPGTLSLALTGLAGWLATRRRKQTIPDHKAFLSLA